ncbi:hypothetical protein ALO83_104002 [Pseudomonas cannabina pv. alisalensis]|uniref:Type VI secretion protein n=1 Tax=Pseudomonas cannabina TaxID=86840 RepID=A0A3M3Q703_PSECA|nr:hypothetical protein ALO83_104002 [Pseudomonas cannabina pv. alisalensis]RMN79986.1 hypothetical protein ALQ53_103736 [Pseudomonas cannabina]RMN82490.1 hypothetical protein ALQ52_104732 [Pseudomonas cannabina pv. alisalensis]RMN88690.1 hypothetical protein ALQ51_102331 [Pseudomonas cannabina]SDQ98610.1 hypothetical protein SAMN05216597_1869 [Pseudomonas cannabina]
MNVHGWRILFSVLAMLVCLVGCSGHFKFSDDQYRALGNPEPVSRNR